MEMTDGVVIAIIHTRVCAPSPLKSRAPQTLTEVESFCLHGVTAVTCQSDVISCWILN